MTPRQQQPHSVRALTGRGQQAGLVSRRRSAPRESPCEAFRSIFLNHDAGGNPSAVVGSKRRRAPYNVWTSLDNEEVQPSWHDRRLSAGWAAYGCQQFEIGIRRFESRTVAERTGSNDHIDRGHGDTSLPGTASQSVRSLPYTIIYRKFRERPCEFSQDPSFSLS